MAKDLFEQYGVTFSEPRGPVDLLNPAAPPRPDAPVQTRRGLREQASLVDRVSYEAGTPVLPESDLTWGQRADLGLSDTADERAAKFKATIAPEGDYRTIKMKTGDVDIYRRSPDEPWRMRDTPTFDWKDIADSPQDVATTAAQAGIAAAGPVGIGAQLGLQALASGVTHLGKEGIESLRGFQQQPAGEVLGQAGITTLGDLAAGALPAGFARMMTGPKAQASQTMWNDFEAIKALQNQNPNLADPLVHQINPDNLILGRLAAQSSSTSPVMKQALRGQQMSFGDLLNQSLSDLPGYIGRTLTTAGRPAMTKARNVLMRDFKLNTEEAGKAIKGIFDWSNPNGFYRKSRQEINKAYADAGRQAEGVSFDITDALDAADEVTRRVDATATTTTDTSNVFDMQGNQLKGVDTTELVNVVKSRGNTVNSIASILNEIDPQQANWEVLKELRSQLGDVMVRNPKDENVVSGAAKRIYGELTRALENPIGGSPGFVKSWQKANSLARRRFEVYEQGRVQQILANDSPTSIAKMFMNDTDTLTPVIREVIDQYDPGKRQLIKKSIQSAIMESPNSAAQIQRWTDQSTGNKQAYDWLFPDKASRQQFRQAAEAMDELRASPLAQMLDTTTRQIDRGKVLLSKVGPAELETTIRQMGGRNSKAFDAMRMAAMDDILTKSMVYNKEGIPTINTTTLRGAIEDARRSGVWEKLFTKEDKIRIRGLDAYARRVFKSLSDTGTSLEQAQAVAALKHPSTFFQGVTALAVNNRVLPPLLLSKSAARLFKPRPPRGPTRKDAWFVFAGQLGTEIAKLAAEHSAESE